MPCETNSQKEIVSTINLLSFAINTIEDCSDKAVPIWNFLNNIASFYNNDDEIAQEHLKNIEQDDANLLFDAIDEIASSLDLLWQAINDRKELLIKTPCVADYYKEESEDE